MLQRLASATLASLLALPILAPFAPAQGILIPVGNRRGHVFDKTRGILCITTADGKIARYDVAAQQLLPPFQASPNALLGCDITPDGAFLYACDAVPGPTQGFVRKVNLANGQSTPIPYNLGFFEGGGYDLAIAANGKAFFTAQFNGSGWVALREIDLATGTVTVRTDALSSGGGGQIRQNTQVNRGGDRSLLYFTESNISSGPAFTYQASTNSFVKQKNFNTFMDSVISSVSRDGSRIAMELSPGVAILDPALNGVTALPNLTGGTIFDPAKDRLYAVDAPAAQLRIFEVPSWQAAGQLPIGEPTPNSVPFGPGEMSASDNGVYVFLSTNTGVRMLTLGTPPPKVTAVVPGAVPYDTPTPVTVAGKFFSLGSAPQVTIGGLAANGVVVVNDTTIQCTTPVLNPGPATVTVANEHGAGALPGGLLATPALTFVGTPQFGGSVTGTFHVQPGVAIAAFLGLGPSQPTPLPPYGGEWCLKAQRVLFEVPFWPLDNLQFTITIPNVPSLVGSDLLVQGLVGPDLPGGLGAFTNCVTLDLP